MAFINRDATGEAKIIRVFIRTMNNESIYVPYCMKLELKYAPDKRILYEQFYVQPYNAIPFIVLCDIIVIYSVLQQWYGLGYIFYFTKPGERHTKRLQHSRVCVCMRVIISTSARIHILKSVAAKFIIKIYSLYAPCRYTGFCLFTLYTHERWIENNKFVNGIKRASPARILAARVLCAVYGLLLCLWCGALSQRFPSRRASES